MATALDLIARGYFPREIPQAFNARDLAILFGQAANTLPPPSKRWTACVSHNLARAGGQRRPLDIPNPIGFVALAQTIEAQWPDIRKHLYAHNFSRSRPAILKGSDRAVSPRLRFGELPKLRARSWRGNRYVLRADINRFYPTLYTHSIPWALHTKAVAKARLRQRGKRLPGELIDEAVRNTRQGQTIGIPTGPDTSLVVAEIVLTAVDDLLAQQILRLPGHRYIDDYELPFATLADAEEAQVALEGILADFELSLNGNKTEIVELPQPILDAWVGELLTFPIRTRSSLPMINDVVAYFSRAFEIAQTRRGHGAIRYALLRSRTLPIRKRGWRTFQGLVLTSVSSEPTTLPVALDLLQHHAKRLGAPIDRQGVASVLESQILRHTPLRNGSEVAWALWTAIALGIDLGENIATIISKMEDDLVALLALDAAAKGRFPNGVLDTSLWESLVSAPDALVGEHWLLAYESLIHGWLTGVAKRVASDPFFSVLHNANVQFYDGGAKPDPFTGPAGPLPGGQIPTASV